MTSAHLDPARDAQQVLAPPGHASHALVVTLLPGKDHTIRDLCSELPALVRAVGSRDQDSETSCVVGFSYRAWRRIAARPAPAGMRPFEPVHGVTQTAPATPGEVFFHVRAARRDLCFELVTHVTAALRDAARVDLEVQAFRHFDNRSVLGFVDNAGNPTGQAAAEATLIGTEDPEHAGGSFVLVQTYLHDLRAWSQLHVCEQERVIGREKVSNLPLRGESGDSTSRATSPIADAVQEHPVLRCSMAFGSPALEEFGTLFVGYSASSAVLESALRTLFVGVPVGNYHPVLDFSTAVSGGLFYVPSAALLKTVAARGVRLRPVTALPGCESSGNHAAAKRAHESEPSC